MGNANAADMFNRDLNAWDVASVTDMYHMFNKCGDFEGGVSSWDVSRCRCPCWNAGPFFCLRNSFCSHSVTDMGNLFYLNYRFNDVLNSWDVASVTALEKAFEFVR